MTTTRRTILQLVPSLQTGGAERTTIDIAEAIVRQGWRALVASAGGRMVAELDAVGARHFTMPLDRKNPIALLANSRKLDSLIASENVDLLHARSRGPAWSAFWAARRKDIPLVTTYHGAYRQTNRLKAAYNSVMVRGDRVIANSQWTAARIATYHPWAAKRIVTIPRGTDFSAFHRSAVSPERLDRLRSDWELRKKPDAFIFLHLARLTGWKGQDVVIEAASQVVKARPDALFILAGDAQGRDGYLGGLRKRIDRLGLADNVLLPGHCDDPAAAVALADAVVVASTQPEAFGRAAVEAGALEKPVIVTDIGAVSETVIAPPGDTGPRTGWKVEPGNVGELAGAMLNLLSSSEAERQKIGQNARQHGEKHFSLSLMCAKTLAVYGDLLGDMP